jgi:hypothetical protein
MESWMPFFVIVAAVAIVLQMLVMLGMFLSVRQLSTRLTQISTDLHTQVTPMLTKINLLLDDSRPRVISMVSDWAEFSQVARNQAVKFDRVIGEGMELLRGQILRADTVLTGAVEAAEDVSASFRKSVLAPVSQLTAVLRGIKAGLEMLSKEKRRAPAEGARAPSDEELFI